MDKHKLLQGYIKETTLLYVGTSSAMVLTKGRSHTSTRKLCHICPAGHKQLPSSIFFAHCYLMPVDTHDAACQNQDACESHSNRRMLQIFYKQPTEAY